MIAHQIVRKSGKDKFGQLAAYVLDAKKGIVPGEFSVLANYVTNADGARDGNRVVGCRITNVDTDNIFEAVKWIEATQSKNTRSKADKTYHLVVSFPAGERPSLEQLRDIEDTLCAAIGYRDHERISAIHDDTDNLHVHIAINKIHPVSFRNVELIRTKRRLMDACVELEEKHDLVRVGHGQDVGQHLTDRANKMENFSMRESLLTWVNSYADEIEALIDKATNWSDVHKGLAQYGLSIRPRGAGLVIFEPGSDVSIKASSISPTLAHKALTDRFGEYTKSESLLVDIDRRVDRAAGPANGMDNGSSYTKRPRQKSAFTAQLFEKYSVAREEATKARKDALDAHQSQWDKYNKDLRANHAHRWNVVKTNKYGHKPIERKAAALRLKKDRRDEWDASRLTKAAQRRALLLAHKVPTWQDWLQGQAAQGNVAALESLRSLARHRERVGADVLSATNYEAAKTFVLSSAQIQDRRAPAKLTTDPDVKRNGDVVYRLSDGGRVTDTAGDIRCDQLSIQSAFLCLALGAEKYQGQPLKLSGTETFIDAALLAAALPGFDLRFEDPSLEARRQKAVADRAGQPTEIGAAQYVEARNNARSNGLPILPHRLAGPSDIGGYSFEGRRKFNDGSEAILLRRDQVVIVKPASPAQMAKASTWTIGSHIEIDGQGRFTTPAIRGGREN